MYPSVAPRIGGMARDPRVSLGRRGAHGAGLVGVFRALSVAAVESLRVRPCVSLEAPYALGGSPVSVYGFPCVPMRAPHIWGVARNPKASLDRRGTHGADLWECSGRCRSTRH